jgi:hypothetical protein
MRIFVAVKPKAKENKIEKTSDNRFSVWVKEPPVGGRANEALRRAMARHFGVPLAKVKIVSGFASRRKAIEIFE